MDYEVSAGKVRICPVGDIDIITAEEFKAECVRILEENKLPLLFDCKDVDFIDSTGLGVFVHVQKAAEMLGLSVSLQNLKPGIKKLFVITRLDEVMRLEEQA